MAATRCLFCLGLLLGQGFSPFFTSIGLEYQTRLDSAQLVQFPKLFRINACRSVSRQAILNSSRINAYEKTQGGGPLLLTSKFPKPTLFTTEMENPIIEQSLGRVSP